MCTKTPTEDAIDNYIGLLYSTKPQCSGPPATGAMAAAAGADPYCPAHVILMVGGPGSGKTAARSACISQLRRTEADFVIINPDDIIASLFAGDNSCRGSVTPIIDRVTEVGRSGGYSVVYDTLGNNAKWLLSVGKAFKESGYIVSLCIVDNNKRVALTRMKEREERTGQPMPPADYINQKYAEIPMAIKKYLSQDRRDSAAEVPDILDNLFVYDNRGDQLNLVFARRGRDYECADMGRMKRLFPDVYCRVCGSTRGGGKTRKHARKTSRRRVGSRHTRRSRK